MKKRKLLDGSVIPVDVWTVVFEFLQDTTSFISLYLLNSDFHNFNWKPILKRVDFIVGKHIKSFDGCDVSYVSLDVMKCNHVNDVFLSPSQFKGVILCHFG